MFLNFIFFFIFFFPTPPHALTFTPGLDGWLDGEGVMGEWVFQSHVGFNMPGCKWTVELIDFKVAD